MGNQNHYNKLYQQSCQFPYQNYYKINHHLWGNFQNQQDQCKQYQIILNNIEQAKKFERLFILRKVSDYLVKTLYFNLLKTDNLCSERTQGTLFIQNDQLRLTDITNIPFPDYLHVYNQCFKGFQQLYDQFGALGPDQQHIIVNSSGQIKVWIHQKLQYIVPQHQMAYTAQTQMLRQLLFLIRRNITDQSQYRLDFLSNTFQNQKTFKSAHQTLTKWCKKEGIIIPQRLNFLFDKAKKYSINFIKNELQNRKTEQIDSLPQNHTNSKSNLKKMSKFKPQCQNSRFSISKHLRNSSQKNQNLSKQRELTSFKKINQQNISSFKFRNPVQYCEQSIVKRFLKTPSFQTTMNHQKLSKPKTGYTHLKNKSIDFYYTPNLFVHKFEENTHNTKQPQRQSNTKSIVSLMQNPVIFRKQFVKERQKTKSYILQKDQPFSKHEQAQSQIFFWNKQKQKQYQSKQINFNKISNKNHIFINQNTKLIEQNNFNQKNKQNLVRYQIKVNPHFIINNEKKQILQSRFEKSLINIQHQQTKSNSPIFSLNLGTRRVQSLEDASHYSQLYMSQVNNNNSKLFIPLKNFLKTEQTSKQNILYHNLADLNKSSTTRS